MIVKIGIASTQFFINAFMFGLILEIYEKVIGTSPSHITIFSIVVVLYLNLVLKVIRP
jgi:hypothetical protein